MKNIIEKCINELKKPKPRKDYVIGMLEALMDAPRVEIQMSDPRVVEPIAVEELPKIIPNKKPIIPRGILDTMNPPPEMRLS